MNSLPDSWTRLEPLREDLKQYVRPGPLKAPMFHHPFMINLFFDPERAGRVNERVTLVEELSAKSLEMKQWGRYVWWHERPYRIEAFQRIVDKLADEDYWPLLGDIWTDSENIWQNLKTWKELLTVERSCRELIMDPAEQDALEALPRTFTVYRGCNWQNRKGLSRTLDKDKANWFARRFGLKGNVIERRVNKKNVIAHFLGRGEKEIVMV